MDENKDLIKLINIVSRGSSGNSALNSSVPASSTFHTVLWAQMIEVLGCMKAKDGNTI